MNTPPTARRQLFVAAGEPLSRAVRLPAPLGLHEALAQVPDPCNPKGVRHPLHAGGAAVPYNTS
jgi:hypothetical protein